MSRHAASRSSPFATSIVAERAIYLADASGWTDATATTGATAPALRWGLVEGITGMALDYAPYLLIANPGTQPAE